MWSVGPRPTPALGPGGREQGPSQQLTLVSAGRGLGQRRGVPSGGVLTAQSRPSPLNGPLSLAIECCVPAPWRRPATAISGEAGMRRAGLRLGVGAPVLTPAATQADSIGI